MKKIALIACCLLVCLLATNAIAANQVTVQSRTFAAGQTACTVGVFIDNDVPITGLVIPLEIRTQSGTAFYLGNLIATVWNFTPTGRLKNSPLGDVADPNGLWPAGNVTRRQLADPVHVDSPQVCSGPISSSWAVSAARGDTISPDGFLLATVSSGDPNIGEEITLPVGSDGATPSMRFLINLIPGQDGCMKIDTCCVTPANHLVYVDNNSSPVFPAFTAGLLTVGATGNCAEVVNQPPTAICRNVTVAADGNCQGTATADDVDSASFDSDGTIQSKVLHPAGPYALGANPVWLVVTDDLGDMDSCQATITVVDTTKPVVTCDTDITVSNDPGQCGAIVNYNYSVSDACGPTTLVEGPASGALFPIGSTLVRIIGVDDAGNRDTCEFHVTVNDTTKPSISCPGPISVQCSADIPDALDSAGFVGAGGSLADNCPNYHFSFLGATSDGQSCPEVLTRRYVITDAVGNADTCEQTITVDDTIAPVNQVCANDTVVNVPSGQSSAIVNYSTNSSFTDNCDGNPSVTYVPPSGSNLLEGIHEVLVIGTDECGNADTCTFQVTINIIPSENLPPTAICQSVVVDADANCEATVLASEVNNGSNDSDGSIQSMVLHPAGPYPLGVNGVWLVVTDDDGAVDSCNTTITVEDNADPTITCPDTVFVECLADVPAPYDSAGFLAAGGSFSDNCGPITFELMNDPAPVGSCPSTITRTYRVLDGPQHADICQHTIVINDTTPPSVICPVNINASVSAGTIDTIITYTLPGATDNCDASPSVVANLPPGSTFVLGETVVQIIATDDCGNADTCTFTVTITEESGQPVPPIAICTDVIAYADANCVAIADINNGSFDPDGGAVTTSQNPAGPYPLGPTLVLLTVTDNEGETDTCSAWVTVNDTTPPSLQCSPINVNNDSGLCSAEICFEVFDAAIDATDNCGSVSWTAVVETPVKMTMDSKSGICNSYPVGTWDMWVIAWDNDNNFTDTCWTTLTVNDIEPPVAACPPDTFTVPNNPGVCTAVPNFDLNGVGSTDNCQIETSVYTPAGNSVFPLGTTQVQHVVTDPSGNADTCYFFVTVVDTQAPTVTCPANIVVFAPFGQLSAVVNYIASATDCGGLADFVCTPPSGSSFPLGVTTVTCTATDLAGNTSQCQFTIEVLPGGEEAPGPHTVTDTLVFNVGCDCDTQYVELYCVGNPTKGEQCSFYASSDVDNLTIQPSSGLAPSTLTLIACGNGDPQWSNSGWVYLTELANKGTIYSDSFFVIVNISEVLPGIAVTPDTLEFTYTGDIFNDKLCLPAQIVSTGCGEACWELVGPSGDWVWVDPTSGTTPDEVEICVTPCSLLAGVYYQTLLFCVCPTKGEEPNPVGFCDQLVVKLTVTDPPVLVVDPLELHFEIKCDQKALPLPVYITNDGGGVLDWNAWTLANWFTIEPADGTAPDTFWVSLLADSLKCPEVCDTLIDSICVYGNKGCALNSPQWVTVELVICPSDSTVCDSICGVIYDCACIDNKLGCNLADVHVELWDSYPDGSIIDSVLSANGAFCFDVEPGVEYDIRAWKKGYCTEVIEDWSCEDGSMFFCLEPLDFTPLPNWPYFTDYYSTNAQFVSGGLPWPIIPGDVIYATDPDGVICGIYWVEADGTYLIHVLGDDPKTLEDEGAVDGDSVTLWLNCECPVVAPDTWVNFGNFQFDALWDCENVPLCCNLCVGWNMWSYNRVLPDVTREAVLATIDLNYDAVRSGLCDYGSISWFDGRPVNDLVNVGPSFGYDIRMTAADTVCIEGELIDPTTPIYLCQGWNYIPYWPNDMDNLGHALQSLDGNYTYIFTMYCDYGVASWSSTRPINDLFCMEPCHGYWINMISEDTLIYPAEVEGCRALSKVGSSSSASRVTATPMVADYYAGSSSLSTGSVISVRNSSGTLIGESYVVANGAYLVHVYGDVPYTPEVEGAVYGESLTFEINGMAASAGREITWADRDNQAIDLTVDAAAAVPTEYSLLQNYPNPFNAGTVIPFVMKDASQWTLTVYNIMGQTVQTFEGFDAAGTVRVDWNGLDRNGASVPSGVYFYRVTTPEWSATKKMTLLK